MGVRSAGRGPIVRTEDCITGIMHPVAESGVGRQVFTVEHIRSIDAVHDIAVCGVAFDPEFQIIARNKLTFPEREHHVF